MPIGDISERKSIWLSFIQFAVGSVNEESLTDYLKPIIQRAANQLDKESVWLYFGNCLQKSSFFDTGWNLILSQFKGSTKIWENYFSSLAENGRIEDARSNFKRAFDSISNKSLQDGPNFTKSFAVLEFKNGHVERGRSLFDKLLNDYPRRFDFWNVYIDEEIKFGDENHVRALFKRILNIKLKDNQTKLIFRKWIEYEISSGHEEKKEEILKLARQYVAQHKEQ